MDCGAILQLLLTTALSVLVAIAVPLAIEHVRRPILRIELGDPIRDSTWSIAHLRVRNLPLAERGRVSRWLGRWLTAFAADGCLLRVLIFPPNGSDVIGFDGKWSSQREPISTDFIWTGSQPQRIDRYDPQKLPGIHETTLQPGRDGDMVAVAIRECGAANAYAYWPERIYDDAGGLPFPQHPDCELPPGTYRVKTQVRAGEVHSAWRTFELVIERDSDSISLEGLDATE